MIELPWTTIRRTVRSLRRSPGYVAVAVLSIGLGIGLATATFAMVETALNPAPRYADVDHVFTTRLTLGEQRRGPPITDVADALRAAPAVLNVGTVRGELKTVRTGSASSLQRVGLTSPGFWEALRPEMILGRVPSRGESESGIGAVVTPHFWHDMFGGQPTITDQSLVVDGRSYAVVGVLVAGTQFDFRDEVWIPDMAPPAHPEPASTQIVTRLRANADTTVAYAQFASVAAGFSARYVPADVPPYRIRLYSLRPSTYKFTQDAFGILLGGLGWGILLIACTNVAALALARGLSRRRDFALRMALGASRWAVARDVIAEVAVLGVLGASVGLALAFAFVGLLQHIVPASLATIGYFQLRLDGRVFAAVAAALITGLMAAAGTPAWRISRVDPAEPIKDGAATSTGRGRKEFRVLVIGELAIAMVLLMLNGLMVRSAQNIVNYDYGYPARSLLSVNIGLDGPDNPAMASSYAAIERASLSRVRELPGVTNASTFAYDGTEGKSAMSDAIAKPANLHVYYNVGFNFLRTLGVHVIAGRDFTEGDQASGTTAILSQQAARYLFPGGNALGRLVKMGPSGSKRPWLRVIGIISNVDLQLRYDPDKDSDPVMLTSFDESTSSWQIVVKPTHADAQLGIAISRALNGELPLNSYAEIGSWLDSYALYLDATSFFERLLSTLSAASLLLGAAGLFAVLSYTVGQRMREFAVRSALGATPAHIARVVLRGAFELSLGGAAIGALFSFWASAGLSSFLYGVKNTDPVALIVAELTLLVVALAASIVPAIRAMRADPVSILRST